MRKNADHWSKSNVQLNNTALWVLKGNEKKKV